MYLMNAASVGIIQLRLAMFTKVWSWLILKQLVHVSLWFQMLRLFTL